jgi:hypothetical protein
MRKISFILLLFIAFSINASAQFTDFPAGYSAVPKIKLKGAVHTVLTIEQRGEHVFETYVEVYDKSGRLIEKLNSNANIEIHSNELVRLGGKTIFTYDLSGKLIKEKYFTPEGEYHGYSTYIYDSKNLLVEDVNFDIKGKERGKTIYTYFPDKREVEVKWSTIKILLSYNEKNQWIKRTGFGSSITNFEYDNNGNILKEAYGSYWHNYSYKFDKQGNWIERQNEYVQYDKNGKEEVSPGWMHTYRTITYYSDSETKP